MLHPGSGTTVLVEQRVVLAERHGSDLLVGHNTDTRGGSALALWDRLRAVDFAQDRFP
jgi:hypothetical protein